MGRIKFLFLAAIMLTFLGVTAWSTWTYDRAFKVVTNHAQLSAWSLAQLELELHQFEEKLTLYQSGHATAEALNLNYDIAWNRLDIFINSEETRNIRSRFDAERLTRAIFAILQKYESNITEPSPDDPRLKEMSRELEQYMVPLRDLMVRNFTGPGAMQESKLLHQSKTQSLIAMGILLLAGLAMLAILFRETKRQHFLAWNDPLTGLPNRAAFGEKMSSLLAKPDTHVVLCLIDLSRFKEVNNSFGHATGDKLLTLITGLLRQHQNDEIYLARIGSDEFAVVMSGSMSAYSSWFTYSRKLYNQLEQLLYSEDPAHRVKPNMGISQYPQHADTLADMVLFADLALLSAKQDTQLRYQVFNRFMLDQYQRKRLLASQLRELLATPENTELYLCYQPIINLCQPQQLGAELLIRWKHPKLNFISPPDIIQIAEENGLGEKLGEWLFRRMQHDLGRFPADTLCHLNLSINLSSSIFNHHLIKHVCNWLQDGPLPASQLILELTENIVLEDMKLSRKIFSQLREKQIRIALDDFGTGWSSFSYLKDLNFDKLKIDKSFIQNLDRDERLPLFVRAITDLSHQLGISVVAEGVETESELRKVLEIGANEIQGYHYSRPLDADAFLGYARHYLASRAQPAQARTDLG